MRPLRTARMRHHRRAMTSELSILLCYDGSANADEAVRAAARTFPGARALVVHVRDPVGQVPAVPGIPGLGGLLKGGLEEMDREAERVSQQTARRGAQLAADAGLRAEGLSHRAERRAWRAILGLAAERESDVVVVGRRGASGAERALLGSVSAAVVEHADRPVLVVPPGAG